MKISLNNLTMSHQSSSPIKQKYNIQFFFLSYYYSISISNRSSWLFYQNKSIELIYNNDLITKL